jgi:hypothetical protein
LTEQCSEKYANKLIGKRAIEDALKRLDKLTHEEARLMTVTAQNLKVIHTVGKTVRGVADKVVVVVDGYASFPRVYLSNKVNIYFTVFNQNTLEKDSTS